MDGHQVETVLFSTGNVLLAGLVVSLIYKTRDIIPRIIIHSASGDASADVSADMPKNRLIKLKIILKHSRML